MNKFAIVIFYEGSQPSDRTKEVLANALCDAGVVHTSSKNIYIYGMKEEEIVANVAARPLCTLKSTEEVKPTPEQGAVLIISKRYGKSIVDNDMLELYLHMHTDASNSRTSRTHAKDVELDRAIIILASNEAWSHLSFDSRKDAETWKKVLEVIRKVYNSVYANV